MNHVNPSLRHCARLVSEVGTMCKFSLKTRPSTSGFAIQKMAKRLLPTSRSASNDRATSAQLFGRSPFAKSRHARCFGITGASLKSRLKFAHPHEQRLKIFLDLFAGRQWSKYVKMVSWVELPKGFKKFQEHPKDAQSQQTCDGDNEI